MRGETQTREARNVGKRQIGVVGPRKGNRSFERRQNVENRNGRLSEEECHERRQLAGGALRRSLVYVHVKLTAKLEVNR